MWEQSEHTYFEQEVKPLLGGKVRYIGEVDATEKRALLAGAIALLNPISWPEPFGLTMIEAAAAGTPVIAHRWGAAPEIVRHGTTGFLCASLDDLTEAMRNITTIDRHACRALAETDFAAARMVREHVALYETRCDDASHAVTSAQVTVPRYPSADWIAGA
jgi:glycosyltransferase involved in cell wall biosynthesis